MHNRNIFNNGIIFARTRNLDLISSKNNFFCFIKAVAIEKKFPAIIMSESEYYQEYAAKFVGPNKRMKVNYLRKAKNVLLETFNGLAMRRYEVFEEDISIAIQTIQVQ